jgi:hypothetical protein
MADPLVPDHPSGSYIIDLGEHQGHRATIVARGMPGERFGGKWFVPENWVVCECGAAWGYVDSSADGKAKD